MLLDVNSVILYLFFTKDRTDIKFQYDSIQNVNTINICHKKKKK